MPSMDAEVRRAELRRATPLLDVAVIGAGPMGSFAAARLARAGLRVGLFEKDAYPGKSTVCAGGMHADLIDFLELPETLIEKTLSLRMTVDGRPKEWRYDRRTYFTVERSRLDAFLAERAVGCGAQLVCDARVIDVSLPDNLLLYQSGRETKEARARVFVFADGPRSLGRRLLGEGTPAPLPEFVAVEYDLAAPENEFDALEMVPDPTLLPFGYTWVFPKRDRLNVGLARLDAFGTEPLWGLLDAFIARRPELRGRAVLSRKGGLIPAAIAPVLQKGNGLAIGDAAGMVNPLSGGGYVCGFQSAALAAEVIVEAFRSGELEVEALREYPRRLRRTRNYRIISLGTVVLGLFVRARRLGFERAYVALLRSYLTLVNAAMRFMPVLPTPRRRAALPGE